MNGFSLHINGSLESVQSTVCSALYAKLSFTAGPDWTLAHGFDELITQLAYRPSFTAASPFPSILSLGPTFFFSLLQLFFRLSSPSSLVSPANDNVAIWACPLTVSWRSTNVYGWPHAVVAVYGIDTFGRDRLVGYAAARIPLCSGRHTIYAPLFAPLASSRFNQFLSWFSGRPPELLDHFIVAQSDSRQALGVTSDGMIKLVLNVAIKDLEKFGYQNGSGP